MFAPSSSPLAPLFHLPPLFYYIGIAHVLLEFTYISSPPTLFLFCFAYALYYPLFLLFISSMFKLHIIYAIHMNIVFSNRTRKSIMLSREDNTNL